ncbi:Thylakoid lumenal protein TL20.3, chloroplastic [Vitis vinifera]|uniref:Thylakoid lumenal protein TL20.3, chloroplastic n=1 Tax=Vitis vinifera TaxID=29760 RepID=A0A438ESD3_VITVI|nr:Thylakoid lumenal protein TL20.3, chloroplastic [Vitis vinifera]
MDRMVLNEANLTNAVLARTVLTRSDLGGAVIEGADFSDAVIDLPQKQVHSLFILFLVFFFFGCLTM